MNGKASGHPSAGREDQRHDGREEQRHDVSQGSGWQAALDAQRLRVAIRALPILIGAAVAMDLAFVALYFVLGRQWQWLGMTFGLGWTAVFLALGYLAARRGHLTPIVYLVTLGSLPMIVLGPALIEGVAITGLLGGLMIMVFDRLLAGRRRNYGVVFLLGLAIGAAVLLAGLQVFERAPNPTLVATALNMVLAGMAITIITESLNWRDARYEDSLAEAEAYATDLDGQRATLEERTYELARRARYQEATATIARDAASVLDVQVLLSRIVTLVSEQFGFYHAGIFLLDAGGEWAVLQAASSAGGQRMLARGHRLRVGEQGIVGYTTGRDESRIALDVGKDAIFFDNPDLPDTHSEMALPLRARGQVIGALDVQSTESAAFSEEDVAVLQTLADQVAVAISNARLFQQAQESLEAERRAYGELSRQAWVELVRARPRLGYRYQERKVGQIVEERRARDSTGEETTAAQLPALTLPVEIRGQAFGTIVAHKPADGGEWTTEERALMETLGEQLSLALDSARLYQDTQRRAAREQLTSHVTGRMRESLDVEKVLETAATEMRQALALDKVIVRLGAHQEEKQNSDKDAG